MATINGVVRCTNATVGNRLISGRRTWEAFSDPSPSLHTYTFDFEVDLASAEVPLAGAVDYIECTVADMGGAYASFSTSGSVPTVGSTMVDGQTWSVTVTIDPTGATALDPAGAAGILYVGNVHYLPPFSAIDNDNLNCAASLTTQWPVGMYGYPFSADVGEAFDWDGFTVGDPIGEAVGPTVIVPFLVNYTDETGFDYLPPFWRQTGFSPSDLYEWGSLPAPWSVPSGTNVVFDPPDGASYRHVTTLRAVGYNGYDPDVYPDSVWEFTWTVDLRGNYVPAPGGWTLGLQFGDGAGWYVAG